MTTEDLIDSIKTNKRVRYTGLAFKDYQNEPLEVVQVSFKGAIAVRASILLMINSQIQFGIYILLGNYKPESA